MNSLARYLPWLVVGVAGLFVLIQMAPPQDPPGDMQLEEFARLPVLENGRVKPFDTVARVGLKVVSNKETFKDEEKNPQPAIRWLLDVLTSGPVFKAARENGQEFPLPGE